jgi:ribulose-bisphosphate carboxylase large chain
MPVFSSGQWAGQAVDTFLALGSVDCLYLCGGGIMAHPGGIAAGVRSVRQAWDAALAGESLASYGETHPELRAALDFFGGA